MAEKNIVKTRKVDANAKEIKLEIMTSGYDQASERANNSTNLRNEKTIDLKENDESKANSTSPVKEVKQIGHNSAAQIIKLNITNDEDKEKSTPNKPASIRQPAGKIRHIIAILALSSIVMANMNRQAYNQALVRMIKRKPSQHSIALADEQAVVNATINPNNLLAETDQNVETSTQETETIHSDETHPKEEEEEEEGFEWTVNEISLLQAGFSYGYTFFMIPGGRMSEIYGAKWVIFLSSFGSALCSIMTPFLANTSYTLLVASRIFMGLCQTGVSPALYALCSRWLPPDESSVYLPLIKVGVMLGFMAGSLINGFLPWQIVFYFVGLLGFAWSAFWVFFASSQPDEHKFIGRDELDYIRHSKELQTKGLKMKSSPSTDGDEKNKENNINKKLKSKSAPWLRILKNPIVLAFTFTKFTIKLSTDTQSMQIPMYLRNVFQISDQLNGVLNGANFAIQAIFTGLVAYLAKVMITRKQFGLNKTGIRRLFQGINCFGMALAYLLISFNMGSLDIVCVAVILLAISSMFGAGGEAVLPIDLTTEYSASIMAIANSAANLSGILLPPMVSFFLANQLTSSERWNHVWWCVSAIMACGGLMFTLIVKAKIQGFNEGKKVNNKKTNIDDESSLANKSDRGDGQVAASCWAAIELDAASKTMTDETSNK